MAKLEASPGFRKAMCWTVRVAGEKRFYMPAEGDAFKNHVVTVVYMLKLAWSRGP